MSRFMLIIGLIVSLAVHTWLLFGWPPVVSVVRDGKVEHVQVDVLPVNLAQLMPQKTPVEAPPEPAAEPEPEKQPEPEPEPEPDPEPQPEPKREPEPEPEPKPEAEPEPQPRPEPKAEPQPKVEPQPDTKPAPQPAPRPADEPRPQPPIEQFAEASKTDLGHGDFAGAADGKRLPALLIDWGTAQHALDVLRAGQMKLVVLDTAGGARVSEQVAMIGNQYRLLPFEDDDKTYSNRLRVLRNVPAFADMVSSLGLRAGRDLAVALPVELERLLDRTKKIAANDADVPYLEVDHFRGRFRMRGGQLGFEVTHVQRRSN